MYRSVLVLGSSSELVDAGDGACDGAWSCALQGTDARARETRNRKPETVWEKTKFRFTDELLGHEITARARRFFAGAFWNGKGRVHELTERE